MDKVVQIVGSLKCFRLMCLVVFTISLVFSTLSTQAKPQSHPRVLTTKLHLQKVTQRMYGPRAIEPYKSWFKQLKDSQDSGQNVDLVSLALLFEATRKTAYKQSFIKRIPKSGLPSLNELYALDIMFPHLPENILKTVHSRVEQTKRPWFYDSLQIANGKKEPKWGYHSAYVVAPAYAYSAIFAGTKYDKRSNRFNISGFNRVVDRQLSPTGHFFKIENRIAGDMTFNDALHGAKGGMYDNFGYDVSEESYSALLWLQHFNFTGKRYYQSALHEKHRADFYQNMQYPYKVIEHKGKNKCRKAGTKAHFKASIWNTQTSDVTQPNPDIVNVLTYLFKDPKMQYYALEGIQRDKCNAPYKGLFWQLMFFDNKLNSSPPSDNPTAKYFSGPGFVSMRSDWTEHAAFAVFMAGEGISRRYEDSNSFIIGRKQDVAIHAGARIRHNPNNDKHHWYHIRSASKNTLKIYDPNESFDIKSDGTTGPLHSGKPLKPETNLGGQIFQKKDQQGFVRKKQAFPLGIYEQGNITKFEHLDQVFTYAVGDATASYTKKIDFFEREFLFIRPNTFFVYDRVKSVDEHFKKAWTMHTIDNPKVVDGSEVDKGWGLRTAKNVTAIAIENPANNTHLYPLVPAQHDIEIRGGDTIIAERKKLHEIKPFVLDIPRWLELFVSGSDVTGQMVIKGINKEGRAATETVNFENNRQVYYKGKPDSISNAAIEDLAANWRVNQWAGYQVRLKSNAGNQVVNIVGNSITKLYGRFQSSEVWQFIIERQFANTQTTWQKVNSVTTTNMNLDEVTISVPHYFDTKDARGKLHSYAPNTDRKHDNLYVKDPSIGQWTIDISPQQKRKLDNFFNVLVLQDPQQSVADAAELFETPQTHGAFHKDVFVSFNKDKGELTQAKLIMPDHTNMAVLANFKPNTMFQYIVERRGKQLLLQINSVPKGNKGGIVFSSDMGLIMLTHGQITQLL